jgi:tetratricopeptide (TPR) repeat protein
MAQNPIATENALEIDRLASQLAKDPHSKVFMPLAEEYGKVGMWKEAATVLEDGLKLYPGFITAMVALGRAYDHLGQAKQAKAILEESVKLSPENLRAHRTLIKIYTSEGLGDLARKSCTVILAVNPRDEEALSVQAALGGPLKQPLQPQLPKAAAPVTTPVSTPTATAPPAPVKVAASAPEPSTAPDLPASTPDEPEVDAADPNMTATEMLVTALRSRDQTKQSLAEPVMELPAPDRIETPPPSPHAEVVAQLESWLRTINSRRHDPDSTDDKSDPKPS